MASATLRRNAKPPRRLLGPAGPAGGLFMLAAFAAFLHFEHSGHVVTGMDNQIVWGMPHVFAVFLIVAASGVLNVASIGSVFGKPVYKARAPLSGLLALAMMAGGLAVLAADLGRPDRLIVAMTHFNFKSIFALNMMFYSGFFAIVAAYLVTLMDRSLNGYTKVLGFLAFFWRLALTTATGSIFGFLVARTAYGSALMAPMFIIYSFAYGLAAFLVVQGCHVRLEQAAARRAHLRPHEEPARRLRRRRAVLHRRDAPDQPVFRQADRLRAFPASRRRRLHHGLLAWPGADRRHPAAGADLQPWSASRRRGVIVASVLVVLGGLAQMFVTIVGGQAFPLEIFPGYAISSSFQDGIVNSYSPVLGEFALGFGGIALAFLITVVAVRVLRFLPQDDFAALKASDD